MGFKSWGKGEKFPGKCNLFRQFAVPRVSFAADRSSPLIGLWPALRAFPWRTFPKWRLTASALLVRLSGVFAKVFDPISFIHDLVTDERLDDVFKGQYAGETAELVNHDGHVRAISQEADEGGFNRRALGQNHDFANE